MWNTIGKNIYSMLLWLGDIDSVNWANRIIDMAMLAAHEVYATRKTPAMLIHRIEMFCIYSVVAGIVLIGFPVFSAIYLIINGNPSISIWMKSIACVYLTTIWGVLVSMNLIDPATLISPSASMTSFT